MRGLSRSHRRILTRGTTGLDVFFCNFLEKYLTYCQRSVELYEASYLAESEIASWDNKDFPGPSINAQYLFVTETDRIMGDYRLMSGFSAVMRKINATKGCVMLFSDRALDLYPPATGKQTISSDTWGTTVIDMLGILEEKRNG